MLRGMRLDNISVIFFAWKVRDSIWKVGQYVSNGEKNTANLMLSLEDK